MTTAIISLVLIALLIIGVFLLPGIIKRSQQRKQAKTEKDNRLSDADIDLIFKGIRPFGMSMEDFKAYRENCNDHVKERVKGQLVFNSSRPTVKIENGKVKTSKKSTYVKKRN